MDEEVSYSYFRFVVSVSSNCVSVLRRLNDLPHIGSQGKLKHHPPLKDDIDLSEAIQQLWKSEAAIRHVLRDSLQSVENDTLAQIQEGEGVWAEIARVQTFELIKHQCGAVFTMVRGDIPADHNASKASA